MGVAASGGDGTALGGAMAAPVLHSDILDTLGAEIADGALARGDVLTLAGLERRFGVSRTVVREAMRILESLGMVHRSEEHTSELQSRFDLVCRLLLEKKNKTD